MEQAAKSCRAIHQHRIAAIRLERFGCDASRDQLVGLLRDRAWQVRAFAIRSLARRRIAPQETWFTDEHEPRVVRTALRYRYSIDLSRLDRGVRTLARSDDLQDKMLAVEIAAASGDAQLQKLALETVKLIILRMDRTQAGALSPRLAAVLDQSDLHRPYDWQHWLMKTGRTAELHPAFSIGQGADLAEPAMLAQLEPEQFDGLEAYMAKLGERELDLAICLDCTASMGGEIAAAQGGIDDMMLFVSGIVSSVRVGLVAYRDDHDDYETKPFEFNSDISTVRRHLWELSADGGGDAPEAVYPAMRAALKQLNWRAASTKVLVVIGDAPPHVGLGVACIDLAQRAHEQAKLTTHTIQAKGKDVKHFAEIAKAGGGQCVSLKDTDLLMAEVTGLTLGDRYQDEFREFFQVYLELCR